MNDFWIILTASLVAVNASILGVFLVLRKMSMMGDAISHAVLPGIVVAYFFSGDRTSVFMLIGAALTGVITSLLIDWLDKKAKVQNDAAIGITYTLFFAIGMIMIAGWFRGNVDIDMECVLYGDIALINLDKVIVDGNLYLGPRAFWVEMFAFTVVLISILLGFKGFKLLSFNEDFGKSVGVNMSQWHVIMMALVSLVTVMSFEVVGAVLVVGFIIIPAATAQLVSKKLTEMIFLAAIFGITAVVIGYFLAVLWDVSMTGTMVSCSALIFFSILTAQFLKQKLQKKRFVH